METISAWLIGDDSEAAAWVRRCLERASVAPGASLRLLPNAAQAPADLGQQPIVFLDLQQQKSAEELLCHTRQALDGAPVVALVADSAAGEWAIAQGADDFLIPQETDAALFRRVARTALRQRQEKRARAGAQGPDRFRHYLEHAPDLIFVLDLEKHCVAYVNRQLLLGYGVGDLAQPGAFLKLVHPSDRPAVLHHWTQLAQAPGGEISMFEYRLRPKNADWEWVQSRETVLPDAAGSQGRHVMVSLSVITNRREREAAVRRYAERLQILHEIDQAIVAARSPQSIAQATLRHIQRLVPCYRASVVIFNWDQKTFTPIAELPEGGLGSSDGHPLPFDWFWGLEELRHGELYRIDDLSGEAEAPELLSWWKGHGVRSLVSLPLQAQRNLLGAISFGGDRPDSFTPEDVIVMREVAHMLAIGIGQARLYEQAQHHARKLEQRARRLLLVNDISLALNRPVELDAVLKAAARGLVQVIDLRQVGILLLNEARDAWTHLVSHSARHGPSARELSVPVADRSRVQRLAQQASGVLLIDDVHHQLRLTGLEEHLLEHHADRLMIIPLQVRDEVIGLIGCDIGPGTRPVSREESDLVRTVANLLAVKIEHIRLLQAERSARSEAEAHAASLRERERHLTLLNSVTRATTGLRLHEMMQTVVERLGESSGAQACYITLWDEAQQRVIPAVAYGPQRDSYHSYQVQPGETTLTSSVLKAGHPLRITSQGDDTILSPRIAGDFGHETALAIPMTVGQEPLGALIISYVSPHEFSDAEVALYEQAAGQIALALSAARLFDETRRQLEELRVLHRLATAGVEGRGEDALLEYATQLMKQSLFPDNFGVLLFDEDAQILHRHHTYVSGQHERTEIHIPLGRGICGQVAQTGKAIRSGDVRRNPHYVEADPHTHSELCVPLKSGEHLIGVINVESKEPNAYSDVHERLLSTFAHQLATAIENTRLFAQTQRRAEELEVLGNLSAALRVADGTAEVRETLVRAAAELYSAESVAIFVPGEQPEHLAVAHALGIPPTFSQREYPIDASIAGRVFSSGAAFRSADIVAEKLAGGGPSSVPLPHELAREPARPAIFAPLRAGPQIVGVVAVINRPQLGLGEQDLELLVAMAEITGSALHRAGLMETLELRVAERTRELAEANERLQELDRLKSKFVSDVSHELRTPITSISLYLELIERGSPDRSEHYWAVLRKQTERLNQLIEDILSLSRLQMGRVDVSLAPTDVVELVREIVDVRRVDYEAAGLGLTFEPGDQAPLVMAQPDLLGQVVSNLLANALKYTLEGSARVHISAADNMACITVADTGIGIGDDDLPHIFERFYRGEFAGQSNIPGTGLGLTIVNEIVHLHQGRIEVQSEEGHGATFRIWLPLAGDGTQIST